MCKNKMKSLRKKKQISMKNLSLTTGISERYLYFIENGEKNPSLKTAQKISLALNESVENIFFTSK